MTAYILGAGASVSAGYPLASRLLERLSAWLDGCDQSVRWVPWARNRIVQIRETFGSLDDFEGILGKLEDYGQHRVKPTGATTYRQDRKDIFHDCTERFRSVDCGDSDAPAEGFYPQYLRSDLISAIREYFYEIEDKRIGVSGYHSFATRKVSADSSIMTFNYDVALERALATAGKWDVGTGYGYIAVPDREQSPITVYKLHGSVNWYQAPIQGQPPPYMFSRDFAVLGYKTLKDARVTGDGMGVHNSGTFILPDPRKKFFWEASWEPLWNAAAARLRAADEVFVHGYSMPPADVRARQLLFDNIGKSTPVNIHCRSGSDPIAHEFRSLGFGDVRSFPNVGFELWAQA
jgi:hypothetical protein